MPIIKGLEWTFDTVASEYARLRPGYPTELYEKIFAYIPICQGSKALEIGIGGGQATLPVLETGCQVTAVEYGDHFSRLCREKFKDYPGFSVITGKFEDAVLSENTYDLVFSASAFHWVPEEIGYKKVLSILKKGGAFARLANHPFRDKGNPILCDRIQELYAKYMSNTTPPEEYRPIDAKEIAEIPVKYGFTDIKYELFKRTRTFSSQEYITLLGTYSDHIVLEEHIRAEFFSKIQEAIDSCGGKITIYDTLDLQLARKP